MRHGVELSITKLVVGSNLDESALVAGAVTIVWCGEDGDTAAIVFDLVAVHANFVGSDDSLEVVRLAEALGYVRTELQTNTAFAWSATRKFLGIGPQKLRQVCEPPRTYIAPEMPHTSPAGEGCQLVT